MKKHFLIFAILVILVSFPKLVFCQEKPTSQFQEKPKTQLQENELVPFIVSILPDSLFDKFEYSQTTFFTVSISSRFSSDPTEEAIKDLQKMIIESCKLKKFDGFILNQLVFVKPFDEGKLIAYGTYLRTKSNHIK